MKKVFLLAAISLGLFSCGDGAKSEGQIGQYTTVEVQDFHNAGSVAKGEKVEFDIKMKNTGDYPLMIADISAACACTVSNFEKDPIQPGETTIINATIDTDETGKGVIKKPITVSANTRPSSTVIMLQATVID
ncbi:DUF1573 domain-containing protein [Brumimicrobium mesophilum]|uniref:DUF1573 domain-containing protein n=1 Tax=Brumimicrobium mesophilum TaxID=392717 RepID=UPI000D142A16|nr:DUF1573 domain-containing protein [Brumimicrobium mesophilum]